jgi:nucleoside-diphosphate-sugar epimerase
MSKVLITGGAGFIGSHLCRKFLANGHEVVCVDNFLSGSKSNIEELLSNPKFKLIEFDITNSLDELYKLDKLDGLSAIFHFACPASPNPESPVSYMAHPVETMMVSSIGSRNMLDLALKNNCQIIFASTSEIYGDPLVHPQSETYFGNVNSIGIRSCYDEGKRFMEALAFTYFRKFNAKIKVIRIFNTYGPRMRLDDGRFTINLIDSFINNKPFKMYGDGSTTRSFCYIDDLVDGIIKMYEKDEVIGNVINLGNPGEFTLSDAISVFEKIIGQKLVKQYESSQPDDPKKRKPDISKAKHILNWEPVVDFALGMAKTLEYYRHV